MERMNACMDSHVHWPATGEFSHRLDLSVIAEPTDILNLQSQPHHFRGDWLMGFGWDFKELPTREVLDQWQPLHPVVLSRSDGHSYWVNSEALRRAGLFVKGEEAVSGGRIVRGADRLPTGVLVDAGKQAIDKILPVASRFELRRNLLKGVQIFNAAGFTHIRDMTCTPAQWQEACSLDATGLLTLAVEEFFWLENLADLDSLVDFCFEARQSQQKNRPNNLSARGLKIFIDGSLGSDSAHMSCAYHSGGHGLNLWTDFELELILRKCWQVGLEVAVHCIGDAASQRIVKLALDIQERGVQGRLHLEHVQVLRPETIAGMKNLNVFCHLQPCHYLSDRKWLKEKLGPLFEFAFPWRKLQEAGVPFDFGSDAPLETPSFKNTILGLDEARIGGIPPLLGDPRSYMSHSDLAWCPNTFTEFKDEQPVQVVFRGENVL